MKKSWAAPITVWDTDYVAVWYYPDKQIIHHKFHKFLYGQEFRNALSAGTEAMKKYGARKWLSDDRQNSALRKADLDWANTSWFPQTQKAGWKFWAVVLPENALGQLNMDVAIKLNAKRGIITQMFSNPQDAMTWLEQQ